MCLYVSKRRVGFETTIQFGCVAMFQGGLVVRRKRSALFLRLKRKGLSLEMGRLTLLGLGQRSIQDECIPRLSFLFVVWTTGEDEGRVVMISRDVLGPDELERVQYACGKKGVDGKQRSRCRCCSLTFGRRNSITRTGHDPTCGLHYIPT